MTDTLSMIDIRQIVADHRCQSRTGIEPALVHEYAESIREGANLPPLSTIDTGSGHYLYDGFHRFEAYRLAGKKQVPVESDPGDLWDAVERSCAVNGTHGKRRTSDDKRRAVETMIKVMVHRGEAWSDREIARRCAVSHAFVSNIRPSVSVNGLQMEGPRLATRNGTTYEIDTSNIGKQREADAPPPFEEVDPSDPATFLEPIRATSWSALNLTDVADDEDDWEERRDSTPEECQLVAATIKAALVSIADVARRNDGERVERYDIEPYLKAAGDDDFSVSIVVRTLELAETMERFDNRTRADAGV